MRRVKERIHVPAGRDGWASLRRMPARQHPRHRHDVFELNFVVRGRCTYLVGNRLVAMSRDHLIALHPDEEHILVEESYDHELWIAVWQPAAVTRAMAGISDEWTRPMPSGEILWRLDPARGRSLAGIFAAANQVVDDGAANACLAALLLTAHDAARTAPRGVTTAVHPSVEAAAKRLRADPQLDGMALARAVGLSRGRLSRLFHEQVGVPLATYRNRLRLERARDLLADGRHNLLEAALAAGFGSYAQFHRVVRAQLGVAPRDL